MSTIDEITHHRFFKYEFPIVKHELCVAFGIIAMMLYGITSVIYKLASHSMDTISVSLFTSIR
ncbi:MAG: hypothetical protein J7K22_03650 [Nanoarchaeota archaeon]|nr:hypothetical protein [Nanoarchaeota archaeon]